MLIGADHRLVQRIPILVFWIAFPYLDLPAESGAVGRAYPDPHADAATSHPFYESSRGNANLCDFRDSTTARESASQPGNLYSLADLDWPGTNWKALPLIVHRFLL